MKIPEVEQYEYLQSHLQYLNDKIIEAFSQFITLATAIVGGVCYVHITLEVADPRRQGLGLSSSFALTLVGIGAIILIILNLISWHRYRNTLSNEYPKIPNSKGCVTWAGEALMCFLILVATILFCIYNPLK